MTGPLGAYTSTGARSIEGYLQYINVSGPCKSFIRNIDSRVSVSIPSFRVDLHQLLSFRDHLAFLASNAHDDTILLRS